MEENWIPHPTILRGQVVELLPLEQNHFPALLAAASDQRIWEFYPGDWSKEERFEKIYTAILASRDRGQEYPFVIIYKPTQKIIGSTRLMDIVPYDKRLEIGGTWLMPEYWASAVNIDCKLALLTYCFESLHTHRVQLKHNTIIFDQEKLSKRSAVFMKGSSANTCLRMMARTEALHISVYLLLNGQESK